MKKFGTLEWLKNNFKFSLWEWLYNSISSNNLKEISVIEIFEIIFSSFLKVKLEDEFNILMKLI